MCGIFSITCTNIICCEQEVSELYLLIGHFNHISNMCLVVLTTKGVPSQIESNEESLQGHNNIDRDCNQKYACVPLIVHHVSTGVGFIEYSDEILVKEQSPCCKAKSKILHHNAICDPPLDCTINKVMTGPIVYNKMRVWSAR